MKYEVMTYGWDRALTQDELHAWSDYFARKWGVFGGLDGPAKTITVDPVPVEQPTPMPEPEKPAEPVEPEKVPA